MQRASLIPQEARDAVHAVEEIQRRNFHVGAENELKQDARMFGRHMALRLGMERAALASFRRPAGTGIPSAMLGLEISLDRDDSLEPEDFMNTALAGPSATLPVCAVHTGMEARLGI